MHIVKFLNNQDFVDRSMALIEKILNTSDEVVEVESLVIIKIVVVVNVVQLIVEHRVNVLNFHILPKLNFFIK